MFDNDALDTSQFIKHFQWKFFWTIEEITERTFKEKMIFMQDEYYCIYQMYLQGEKMGENICSLEKFSDMKKFSSCEHPYIIFFVNADGENLKKINKFIDNCMDLEKTYCLVLIPERTTMCNYFLDQLGLKSEFGTRIKSFAFDLVPLDKDLLSLEYDAIMKEMRISHGYLGYNLVAQALQKLQTVYGKFPGIMCKGKYAHKTYQIMRRIEKEDEKNNKNVNYGKTSSQIDGLILLDREVDPLSPLMCQFTYNGLIDEFFDIKGTVADIDRSILHSKQQDPKFPKTGNEPINFSDKTFELIKDQNLTVVGTSLQTFMDNMSKFDIRMIPDEDKIKVFQQLKNEKEIIETHVDIAFYINQTLQKERVLSVYEYQQNFLRNSKVDILMKHIQLMIDKKQNPEDIYRVLLSCCILEQGFKQKQLEDMLKSMVESYGISQVLTFQNMNNCGLLYTKEEFKEGQKNLEKKLKEMKKKVKEKKTEKGEDIGEIATLHLNWKKADKEFNVIKDISKINFTDPDPQDTCYAYNNYTPLMVLLIREALLNFWGKHDIEQIFPGPLKYFGDIRKMIINKKTYGFKKIVICVVGGLTYGEVAAIRLLGKELKVKFLIFVTNIVNGQIYLKDLIEEVY